MKNNCVYYIDHRLSSKKLIPLFSKPHFINYDKSKCEALNFWDLLFPNKELPTILSYVNDRDLWLNKLPNFKEVFFCGLCLEEKTVTNWNKLIFHSKTTQFQNIVTRGQTIKQYNNYDLEYLEKKSYIKDFNFDNKTYKVIYCNSPVLQSDLGNYLISKYQVDFAGIYHFNGQITIFSLRGNNKINLSDIAKKYNGGGHFNAVGCSIPGNVISL